MATMYIEGMRQEVQFGDDAQRLWFTSRIDGVDTAPDSAPTIAIYSPSGSALVTTTNMTLVSSTSATAYYDLDASGTASFTAGELYYAKVFNTVSSIVHTELFYFDVVLYPFNQLVVTSSYIDTIHPEWKQDHPTDTSTGTWAVWCELAHMKIATKIRASGNRARCIVDREELFPYILAECEAQIATGCGFKDADEWRKAARDMWNSKGAFVYETDDDPDIDSTSEQTIGCKVGR